MDATRALLLNPPMPLAFWSFPRLCRLAGAKTLGPPLGLITVAALLPRDWELRLVDLNARPLPEDAWQWADLVLVSGMLAQRTSLLRLIREAKARGKTVVAGGPYPTALPDEVLAAGCDFLVKGEGETAIPLLLQALARGDTGGVIESPTRPDLATSPIPRFDLLHLKDYVAMAVQTSRGCPYDCEFCDVIKLYGRKLRYKEPDQVLAELEVLYRLGWRKEIFICDDNFVGSKSRARAILGRLIPWLESRGNPFVFWTQASIDLGQDPGLMDLMVRAGFSTVVIGIESPDAAVLAQTRKHHNIRHPLLASLKHLRDHGLSVLASFIIGFDGEKPGMGQRLSAFVEAAPLPLVIVHVLVPLPLTSLTERLRREGRLFAGYDYLDSDTLGWQPDFRTSRPRAQIMGEFAGLWQYLYEPRRFLSRIYRYHLAMAPTPPQRPTSLRPLPLLLQDVLGFLGLVWRLGVRAPYRRQFWAQFLDLARRNPTRLPLYFISCAMALDLFPIRDAMPKRLKDFKLMSARLKDEAGP